MAAGLDGGEVMSHDLISHRLAADRCPWCGALADAATNLTGEAGPEPGDITLCLGCTSPLQFNDRMQLAKISDAELRDRLSADDYARFMAARRVMLGMDRSTVGRRSDG